MRRLRRFAQYQLPPLLWSLLIFALSSLPGASVPKVLFGFDKVAHAGVFFVLCWLSHRAFRFQGNPSLVRRSLPAAVLVTFVYGLTDEFHQLYVPGRTADVLDVTADVAGALTYVGIFFVLRSLQRNVRAGDTVR